MSFWSLALIPVFSGLIGWLTNKVAIKMLFHPRKAWRFPGFVVQGLLPRRQHEFGRSVGRIVEREFLTRERLGELIDSVDLDPHLNDLARHLVHDRLGERLKTVPIIGGMINERTLAQIESLLRDEMKRQAKPMLGKLTGEIQEKIDVAGIVEERIAAYDVDELERVATEFAAKEFRAIEILGGVLGFLVGLAQLGLLAAAGALQF